MTPEREAGELRAIAALLRIRSEGWRDERNAHRMANYLEMIVANLEMLAEVVEKEGK